jgi:hypothetical protein
VQAIVVVAVARRGAILSVSVFVSVSVFESASVSGSVSVSVSVSFWLSSAGLTSWLTSLLMSWVYRALLSSSS